MQWERQSRFFRMILWVFKFFLEFFGFSGERDKPEDKQCKAKTAGRDRKKAADGRRCTVDKVSTVPLVTYSDRSSRFRKEAGVRSSKLQCTLAELSHGDGREKEGRKEGG